MMQPTPHAGAREDGSNGDLTPRVLVHVGITVPDIERAVSWYADVLGFDVLLPATDVVAGEGRMGEGAAAVFGADFRSMRIAELVSGNGIGIEFFQFGEPVTPQERPPVPWQPGPFHICVRDVDVDALAARIAANGGKQLTTPRASYDDAPYRWCVCEDPFGIMIEVYSHSHEQVFANRRDQSA